MAFCKTRTVSIIIRKIHSSSHHPSSKIKSLVQEGNYQDALELYSKNLNILTSSNSRFIFPSLLKSCASLSNSIYGGALHSTIIKSGLHSDPFIITSLVQMYVKCGLIGCAVNMFDDMPEWENSSSDAAVWNSIIDGYFKTGFVEKGISMLKRMQGLNVKPDGYTLCILLGTSNALHGREIHGYAVRNSFLHDPFVATAMIDLYSSYKRPIDASNVFDKFENKQSIAVYNAMINGFYENGLWRNSLQLYSLAKIKRLDFGSTTFSSVLTACSLGNAVDFGCQLHCDLVKTGFDSDPYATTSLLTFYSKCGLIEEAEIVFRLSEERKVGIWNSMISAYANSDFSHQALDTYTQMRRKKVEPDSFTILNVLIACGVTGSRHFGEATHGELIKRPIKQSIVVQSSLLTMYSKVGNIDGLEKVFEEMKEKDVVAWGCMISRRFEDREFGKVLRLFRRMISEGVKPDSNVVASVVMACLGQENEKLGFCLHGMVIKEGLDLDSCTGRGLIEFYSKCGEINMAKEVFLGLVERNIVVWNSLISCYTYNRLPDASISLLPRVMQDGLLPDSVTITLALSAAAEMAVLVIGKAIHGYLVRFQIEESKVENTLIDMYTKCGSLAYAEKVFDKMPERDVVAWNAMIAGYSSHGECRRAIDLSEDMRGSGVEPDGVTFLSLISSCNHCGFTDEGLNLFVLMKERNIEPKAMHYVIIVDLLGRAGRLDDARELIESMAVEPGRGVWLALLSACRVHRNVELGEVAAGKLMAMEPENGACYTQLLNLYVEAGLKEKAAELRAVMRQKGAAKLPGCSWIEVKDKVEVFFSGDASSPATVEIYEILWSLKSCMRQLEPDRPGFFLA